MLSRSGGAVLNLGQRQQRCDLLRARDFELGNRKLGLRHVWRRGHLVQRHLRLRHLRGVGSSSTGGSGDTFLPWEGGPAYYAQWSHGPSSDPSFFPIAVWLQSPGNAPAYAAIGINTFFFIIPVLT